MLSLLTFRHLVWSLPLAATLAAWAVTGVLYFKARADLIKARQLARTKDALDLVIAVAPFLGPVVGSALGAAASFATQLVQPAVVAGSEKARRSLAGINSAIYVAVTERLAPQLVGELEKAAMEKLAEQERLYAERTKANKAKEAAKASHPVKRSR